MTGPVPSDEEIWEALMPGVRPVAEDGSRADSLSEQQMQTVFELYKLIVGTSEALVGRRQGVNTFFLTLNGALLTGIGLVLQGGGAQRLVAGGILVIALAGGILSVAWHSLLQSFGQLNSGKFAVINRLEQILPAAIFTAEWKALAEGRNKKVYRTFTSREAWAPRTTGFVYLLVVVLSGLVALGCWKP